MRRKIIYLILICFLLSGCSIDYNLIISQNLTVNEEAYVYDKKSEFSTFKTVDDGLNSYIKEYSTVLDNLKYKYSKYSTTDVAGLKVTNSYNSLNDYVNNVYGFYQYFNSIEYIEKNNISLLRYNSLMYLYDQNPNISAADENNIKITIPYKLLSVTNVKCNYDNKVNICTFNIDENTKPQTSYEIVFDNTTLASKNDNPVIKDKITDNIADLTNKDNNKQEEVKKEDNSNIINNNTNANEKEKMPFKLLLMIIALILLIGFMISLIFIYKYKKNNDV